MQYSITFELQGNLDGGSQNFTADAHRQRRKKVNRNDKNALTQQA